MSSQDVRVCKSVMTQKSMKKSIAMFIGYVQWQVDNPESLYDLKSRGDVLIRDVKETSDLFKKMMRNLKHMFEKQRVQERFILKSYIGEVINLINTIIK